MTREDFEAGKAFTFDFDKVGVAVIRYDKVDMAISKNNQYMAEVTQVKDKGFVIFYWPFKPRWVNFSQCALIKTKP